jgi:hypothetical protein
VERALSALRKLRNAFAHSAESASLADPAHSARLAEIYAEARTNPQGLLVVILTVSLRALSIPSA